MRSHLVIFFLAALFLAATGCKDSSLTKKPVNWNVILTKESKDPYGAFLAFQSLKYYFPEAKVAPLPQAFRFTNMSEEMRYNYYGHSLLILEGLAFHLSEKEWDDLKQFIRNGNEVILFSSTLDDKIEQDLGCYESSGNEEDFTGYQNEKDYDNKDILRLNDDSKDTYGYAGKSLKGYFKVRTADETSSNNTSSQNDAGYSHSDLDIEPDTLGFVYRDANVLRYNIGEGHLTLHAAPLAMSNYFLLQNRNHNYLTGIWRTLPKNIGRIYWINYFNRTVDLSSFDILWRYPATRMALILGLSLLLIHILFEGKRKQRIIPVTAPLKNDSVSFVETVGRLYYNKGNHTNLVEKMVQQFLEWVRTHYFLNTNIINENFIQQLTIKSGQPEAKVRALVEMVDEIKRGSLNTDDAYLYQLYSTIQQFYKNNHT